MKRVCSPNSTSPLMSFSSATIECLERPDVLDDTETYISGGVMKGGKLAWLVRGAMLEVVNAANGSRQASWRFGWSSTQQRSVNITSVAELQMEDGAKLLVGLKDLSGSGAGVVCLFDPFVSRVIKAIDIPYPVTVVEGVTGSGGAQASPHAFSQQLKLLFGVAAIGTEEGHCFLVDLRLDDDDEEFDEWHTSQIELVDPTTKDMPHLRNAARRNGTHLAIEFGSLSHDSGHFSYVKPDFSELNNLASDDVYITAIKYVRQTGSLLVGFNFGCFQIWNLATLSLVYSSQVGQYNSAVSHFMYQEPENDPRYCCYLWVARGPLVPENSPETPATLTLYQLVYVARDILPGYGIVYKELTGVGRRFEHQLTADAHHLADATSVGSKVICCYTLEKDGSSFDSLRVDEGGVPETEHDRDLTLAVCVWEAPSHDPHARPTCHLGIFDINCWYHSQMPPSIRDAMFGSKDATCPFFAFFSLADVLDTASPDGIVDVVVDATSVSSFSSSVGSTLEQHLRPATLKFDACCLMETGLVHSKFLGVQRQILANMSKQGTGCLSDAHEYFNMCYVAGLLPRNFDLSKPQDKSFHYEALFSVALEHGLITFITLCIQKLGTGNVTHAGCSLKLVLDWAWDRVVEIKERLDQLCVPLFDGGGGTPDEQMLLMLDNQKVQLGHLTTIFQALITQSAPTTQQGLRDLEAKYNVVSILSMYLRVLLWLIGQGLLPEQSEGALASSRRGHCYPANSLCTTCESQRDNMAHLSNEPGSGSLMVDKLIAQLGNQAVSQWITKGGSQHYPPSSLHGLCSLYLLEKVNPSSKHSIVFYLLLDLCFLDTDLQRNEVALKFGKQFNMSEGLMKLIHGFWLLDHQHFEAAVASLVDPTIDTELGPWQSSSIIKTLVIQGEAQNALFYMKTTQPTVQDFNDIKLHLTVLLANSKVAEAFGLQRTHHYPARQKELLYHFFTGCQETGNMANLLQLSLDSVEEECLANFLREETFHASKELLVMHYVQRGRYVEGIRLNELLKKNKMAQQEEKAKVRNSLVDAYIKCLPRVQRKLVFGAERSIAHQPITLNEVPRPKPLSTVVHRVDTGRPVSRAVILSSAMDKVEEIRKPSEVQGPSSQRRSVGRRESIQAEPFVCTPVTPKSRTKLSDSNKVDVVFASTNRRPAEDKTSAVSDRTPKAVTSPTFLDKKRRRQFFSGAEALSLLATPPVVKLAHGSSMSKTEAVNITTPQSILKITRVLRRTSPRPSPTSSPPVTRRASSDQLLSKNTEASVTGGPSKSEEMETPSRRIRFATEDVAPSPPSSGSPDKPCDEPSVTEDSVVSSRSDVSEERLEESEAMEVTTAESVVRQETAATDNLHHSIAEAAASFEVDIHEDQEDAEVQITAAVMDLTGDSDIEETGHHEEEDYSSYELDDSDRDNGSEEGSAAVSSEADTPQPDEDSSDQQDAGVYTAQVTQASMKAVTHQRKGDTSVRSSPLNEPLPSPVKVNPPTPPVVSQRVSPVKSILLHVDTEAASSEPSSTPPYRLSPRISEPSSTPPYRQSPRTPPHKQSPSTVTSVLLSHEHLTVTATPPITSPVAQRKLSTEAAHAGNVTEASGQEMLESSDFPYTFSPPVAIHTPVRREQSLQVELQTTPSLQFIFSPPLTRSMSRRRSGVTPLGSSASGKAARSTPHQSPSDSPISFVTPVPQPSSPPSSGRPRGSRKKLVHVPMHSMTLRTRKFPVRPTRSAKLSHTKL